MTWPFAPLTCSLCGWPLKTDPHSRRELLAILRTGGAMPCCGGRLGDRELEELANVLTEARAA